MIHPWSLKGVLAGIGIAACVLIISYLVNLPPHAVTWPPDASVHVPPPSSAATILRASASPDADHMHEDIEALGRTMRESARVIAETTATLDDLNHALEHNAKVGICLSWDADAGKPTWVVSR